MIVFTQNCKGHKQFKVLFPSQYFPLREKYELAKYSAEHSFFHSEKLSIIKKHQQQNSSKHLSSKKSSYTLKNFVRFFFRNVFLERSRNIGQELVKIYSVFPAHR